MVTRRGRRATTGFLRDFQEFALKGNVIELALAVIIGGAFGKIVTSFVEDIVMPIINPLVPQGDWRNLTIGNGIKIGSFLGSILDFAIIALVLFVAIRFLASFKKADVPPSPTEKECHYCLEKVPLEATKCRACTSELLQA